MPVPQCSWEAADSFNAILARVQVPADTADSAISSECLRSNDGYRRLLLEGFLIDADEATPLGRWSSVPK